jgi:dTDP-4-dehydrorhamnose reductase
VKVVVLGRSGQLASALAAERPANAEVLLLGREQCDLRRPGEFEAHLDRSGAGLVINAAAYTAVDQAEREPEEARRVNGSAVGELARCCAARGVRLIHVSTDYVFDGRAAAPYTTEADTAPVGVYGVSKLEGERAIRATPDLDWLIVRTSWLYSAAGRNFMLTMLKLFRTRGAASVVADQFGSPTSARSLARALWRAAVLPEARGLAHFANAGVASWWEFAVAIAAEALARGLLERAPVVTPITTAEYPTLARRPAYSALDAGASLAAWGLEGIPWRNALGETLDELRAIESAAVR